MANKDFRSHSEPLFAQMKLMKFKDIHDYESLMFMHNYVYARLPNSMLNMFTPLKTSGRNGNYLLKRYKGTFLDRFPSSYLTKIWNNIGQDFKNTHKFSSAKAKITKNILQSYKETHGKCDFNLCPDCFINFSS